MLPVAPNLKNSECSMTVTLDMFYIYIFLCAFFWVIPRRLNFTCQRFGTPAYKAETVFRNVGV